MVPQTEHVRFSLETPYVPIPGTQCFSALRPAGTATAQAVRSVMKIFLNIDCRLSEREVNTEVQAGIGGEWDSLLGQLAESVVHTQEEIETCGMHVKHPSEISTECAYA